MPVYGVEDFEVTAVAVAVSVAYAEVYVDAIFEVLERERASRVGDEETALLQGAAQVTRGVHSERVHSVAPNLDHLVIPALGVLSQAVGLRGVTHLLRSIPPSYIASQSVRRWRA